MPLIEAVLTDEHREYLDRADEFATTEVAPQADRIERTDDFPRDLLEEAGRRGLLGLLIPSEFGGEGTDFLSYCLVVERIAEASGAVAESIQGHTFAAVPIVQHGSDEQRERHLPEMASGKAIGAMLLTEPGAGSSPTELQTTAQETSDGYRLSGEKSFGTNAGVADLHLVVARVDPSPSDSHGVSVFLLPSVEETDGFSFERGRYMGMRGHVTGDSAFEDVVVNADAMLGSVGGGFRIAMGTIDMARTGLGAIGTGIARAASQRAIDYAGRREQGGQAIGSYQAVQLLVAEMDTQLDAARHAVYRSAAAIADGTHDTRLSSQAKYLGSETAESVTRSAIQVYGGKGYSKEYPLERYYRDAKILSIIGGTNEIQKTTIAREQLDL